MQANVQNRDSTRIKDGRMVWHLLTDMDNQFVETLDVFPPARVLEKAESNMVAMIKIPDLHPGESFSPTVIMRLDTVSRDWMLETITTSEDELKRLRGTYCSVQKFWEVNDPIVQELSERIAENSSNDESYARLAYQVVRERVKLKTHLDVRLGAAEAARLKEGDCDEHADLLVALCRAVKIPSRRVVGHYFKGGPEPEPHAWSEVYLAEKGWIPVDAALGSFGTLSENYFSRIREGLVSERPTIQVMVARTGSQSPLIEEFVNMRVLANGSH
jgi:transglutaminase-like putative cysteine protease